MEKTVWANNKQALIGGILALIASISSTFLLGHVSDYSAQKLLQALVPNINVLCNTVILVCGTILALLFTVLSLSSGVKFNLSKTFYHRIKQVAIFDTVLIVTATVVFLLLNFPLSKTDALSSDVYHILYYVTLVFISIIGGLSVTVFLMLYNTVSDLIKVVEVLDNKEEVSQEEKNSVNNIVNEESK